MWFVFFFALTPDHLIISASSTESSNSKVSRHLPSIFLLHVLVSEAQCWCRYLLLSEIHCKVWLISSKNQPNFLSVTFIFRTKRLSHILHQQNTSLQRGPTHMSTDAHTWFILTSSIIRESPAAEGRERSWYLTYCIVLSTSHNLPCLNNILRPGKI